MSLTEWKNGFLFHIKRYEPKLLKILLVSRAIIAFSKNNYVLAPWNYTIYMGKDKYENEELLKYAFPEDIW